MSATSSRRQLISQFASFSAILVLGGCGTILYPERRNQSTVGASLDITIVVLDGVLCLLFLVPGVVAFGVDFATGAIYLPGSHARLRQIPVRDRSPHGYESALSSATGKDVRFSDPQLLALTEPQTLDGESFKNLSRAKAEPMQNFYLELDEQGQIRCLRRA